MDEIEYEYEYDPLDKVQFPRKEQAGFFLGLELLPMIAVLILLFVLVVGAVRLPFPFGWIFAVLMIPVIAFVGWGRFRRLHVFAWVRLLWMFLSREVRGQNVYRRPNKFADAEALAEEDEATEKADAQAEAEAIEWGEEIPMKTPKPVYVRLPGAAGEFKLYETPLGRCVLMNPMERTVIIVAAMTVADNYMLADDPVKADLLEYWAETMNVLGDHYEVTGMFPSDVTSVTTAENMVEYYSSRAAAAGTGEELNPVAHQGYLDLLSKNAMTHHLQYLAISLAMPRMNGEIKEFGGGVNGLLACVDSKITSYEEDLKANNYLVDHWVGLDERFEMFQRAFVLEADGGAREVGIMGAQQYWTEMRVNTTWHRSYYIDEWPLKPVDPGFMSKIILDLEFPKTVTQIIQRGDDAKALRKISNDINNQETAQDFAQRLRGRVSRAMKREHRDLQRRESEMVDAGASAIKAGAFITISAESLEQLDSYDRQLASAAGRAQVKVYRCYGGQYEGFLAGAAHVGMGTKRYVV